MLKRAIYDRLISWKETEKKKALCIIGARQTGKTTIIREFGRKNYKYFVEVNFVAEKDAGKIFDGSLDADTIIANLTAYKMQNMEPGETLVFLDEIQECPEARSAVKFLVEDGRFDYIESGSLLGVRHKEVRSYPVGYEEICYMYPMSFEEFITANGVQHATIEKLEHCYHTGQDVPESIHDTMLKLFYIYIVVGGMPAAVQIYIDTHDIGKVIAAQRDILELYRMDISKYADGNDKIKIRSIFDSIPAQLDDKNRRFFLSRVDKNGRQNRYENSFLWLSDAGVALPVYNVTEPQVPLQLNEKRNIFKLFLNDTGLLCAACMKNIQFDLLKGNMDINMGSILENLFAQAIKSNGFTLNYFESKKYGEIDFAVQNATTVDLIEIKSGNDYKKHLSLDHILENKHWKFGNTIVFCKSNVQSQGMIRYLPWYMIMFYRPDRVPEGYIYEIDLSAL